MEHISREIHIHSLALARLFLVAPFNALLAVVLALRNEAVATFNDINKILGDE